MSTLNAIPFTAAGNSTADPELRFTGTGKLVAGVRIAVTPRRFDRDSNSYTAWDDDVRGWAGVG
jgi:single-stranded DNA-binding protein